MRTFTATTEDEGKRADQFVTLNMPEFSRSSLEPLFDKGLVTSDNKALRASYRVKRGEVINIDDGPLTFIPAAISMPTLYEDSDVIVIDKPEGVLTHSKGAINNEATVASFIQPHLSSDVEKNNRAGIVHRLDRATAGVIITAKNKAALTHLQNQFSQRKTKKTYVAVVGGVPQEEAAVIDVPLERNPSKPQTFRVGANGKPAMTQYRVVKSFNRNGGVYSLLELKPTTGRTHQLRVHLNYIGHPIVGDKVYSGEPADHLYLNARQLELTLPTSERRTFESTLPDYFKDFIDE